MTKSIIDFIIKIFLKYIVESKQGKIIRGKIFTEKVNFKFKKNMIRGYNESSMNKGINRTGFIFVVNGAKKVSGFTRKSYFAEDRSSNMVIFP